MDWHFFCIAVLAWGATFGLYVLLSRRPAWAFGMASKAGIGSLLLLLYLNRVGVIG